MERRFDKRSKFDRQNKVFQTDAKKLYREIDPNQVMVKKTPPKNSIEKLCKGIWGEKKTCNMSASCLQYVCMSVICLQPLTSVLTDTTYSHLEQNDLFPLEQKGRRRGSYGCKDQIMINKMILENCKKRKRNLSRAWIDY